MKYIGLILVILLMNIFFYTELDLPVLPPSDSRREEFKKPPGTLPSPQVSPPIEEIPEPPIFFSEVIPATESIVYVLDYSQSMSVVFERIDYKTTRNRWEVVQIETIKSISNLAQNFKFNIVIFGTNKGCGVAVWQENMQVASDGMKASAAAWISSYTDVILYGGATPTAPGVIVGLKMNPESIVLLTDGQPSRCGLTQGVAPWVSHRRRIFTANTNGIPIQVFGIGLPTQPAKEFCQGVAGDSGGQFIEIRR